MSEFTTSGSVTLEVEQRSLRDARDDVESAFGSVTTEVNALPSGRFQDRLERQAANADVEVDANVNASGGEMQTLRSDGGGDQIDDSLSTLEEINSDAQETLVDIRDILDNQGVGGGQGGGGLFGGGEFPLAAGAGGGGGGGGILAAASAFATSNPFTTGAAIGIGGAGLLDKFGIDDTIEGFGQDLRESLPAGNIIGDAAQFLPGAAPAAALPEIAGGALSFPTDLLTGRDPFADFREGFEKFSQIFQNRFRVLGNVSEFVTQPFDGPDEAGRSAGRFASLVTEQDPATGLEAANETLGTNFTPFAQMQREANNEQLSSINRFLGTSFTTGRLGDNRSRRTASRPFGGAPQSSPAAVQQTQDVSVNQTNRFQIDFAGMDEFRRKLERKNEQAKRDAVEEAVREVRKLFDRGGV